MPSEGSITILIDGMRLGDDEAARRIWQHFSPRVAALARQRLPVWLQRFVDGDDLANSAICSVIMGLREGRLQELHDRDELWALLACVTVQKARNEIAKALRHKRPPPGANVPLTEEIIAADLPPDLIVRAAEQFKLLIDLLRNKEAVLEPIALWKFEGYTTNEIAQRLGCSHGKVARKLQLIRKTWEQEQLS